MSLKYYTDYCWDEGIPCGRSPIDNPVGQTYKIVMDPYRRYIAIEQYIGDRFQKVIYDSTLLNFRSLKIPSQTSWQKETMSDSPDKTVCLIRNQDDRAVYIETYRFEKNLCRECAVASIHGIPLSIHRMFYKAFGDPINGVVLFDMNEHPVMYKLYNTESATGEFSELLLENWDMERKPLPFAPVNLIHG